MDLMLNYTFNRTSAVKDLTVELVNQKTDAAPGPVVLAQNWRDSFTAAAGINYRWNDKLTLRTGLQFDQTPVPGPAFRHPGLADN
ncbi:outer membrane protein transport protein, partial [Acinetobacter baumannii]